MGVRATNQLVAAGKAVVVAVDVAGARQLATLRGAVTEVLKVVRRAASPGVELVQVSDSPRVWGHLNNVVAFGTMTSWQGRLTYRRQNLSLGRGDTFLFDPGELFRGAPEPGTAGSFRVIELEPQVFADLCREEDRRASLHFAGAVARAPRELAIALAAVERALLEDADALEQQSALVELAHAASCTVLERGRGRAHHALPLGPCERLRDILHSSEAGRVSLSEFARDADLSQFQLLRAFKRRYGWPPHAYGLHVRIDRARRLLREGRTVAEAAAAGDFTDQSHLTRHFRRIWGVTPGQYAAVRR